MESIAEAGEAGSRECGSGRGERLSCGLKDRTRGQTAKARDWAPGWSLGLWVRGTGSQSDKSLRPNCFFPHL